MTYLHSLKIVHRDLKPENILFAKQGKIKLIDFGQGKFCKNSSMALKGLRGTPLFISPEVIRGSYDQRCDLWALGVLTFFLLSGKHPFVAKDEQSLLQLIASCDYDFEPEDWRGVSTQAKKFI